ncbi:patatin-like phospholipase family protein [Rhizobium sp. RHZ01]|nr:patatin-like phospholipase family protein [Rhizobium sp. RHZ01]
MVAKTSNPGKTWAEILGATDPDSAFGEVFFATYGKRLWEPDAQDALAAHAFHIELISRIATQPLGYSEGVEERALTSVFDLFARARAICDANLKGTTFETLVWYVLNTHVRPFTAKWHAKKAAGVLNALDTTDQFRAELKNVQTALISLDHALQAVMSAEGYLIPDAAASNPNLGPIDDEMSKSVTWRPMGEKSAAKGEAHWDLVEQEAVWVQRRRESYSLTATQPWAAGLALSGGGIRSATFALGVMSSLAKRNLLRQFDYLSTVSGGGYAGIFLTQLLGSLPERGKSAQSGLVQPDDPQVSLKRDHLPFARNEGESELLRTIRQNASYLSGSLWERLGIAMTQAYGIFMNLAVVALLAAAFAFVDYMLREIVPAPAGQWTSIMSIGLLAVFLAIPLLRKITLFSAGSLFWMAVLGVMFLLPLFWLALGLVHTLWQPVTALWNTLYNVLVKEVPERGVMTTLAAVFVSGSALTGAVMARLIKARPILLTILIFIFFAVLETIAFYSYTALQLPYATLAFASLMVIFGYLWLFLDVNSISLHGYYREKLATAFLIDAARQPAKPIRLTEFTPDWAHFPIINCAVNLPGSKNASMRGRLSDVFSFTPVATGSPVLKYEATSLWEKRHPQLDIATAMALSGAAVSPQMGLRTSRYASFWLTLLNLRLGAWLRKAGEDETKGPGIGYLLRELSATADENDAYVHISDGGHIENLGVYELLRRRCRFIVAVDGENDPQMTFHALTNLQRLAYIDFGIVLEVNLDDLRLNQAGLSRSHFQLCRILYPKGAQDSEQEIGYLVYLKLSLTGNEGEFLRRYKLDEPSFPHHSTADQFFSEPQFEAYRALGEHVGEKMFLPAITGDLGQDVKLEEWFRQLGRSFLDPRPAAPISRPAAVP